jgi:predicted TIM-barrel fold metal-dependent hydrolase
MLGLEHGFRVVDACVRLDTDGGVDHEDRTRRRYGPETLQREMHQAGIVRSVVFPRPVDDDREYLRANNAVARGCVERPFVPFARLSGARDADDGPGARLRNLAVRRAGHHTLPEEVEQYAYDDRFEGFVLDPAVDGVPDESVVDTLDDVGRPLLVRTGRSFPPRAVRRRLLGRSFPVILTHPGARPLDDETAAAAVEALAAHERLHLDSSCLRRRAVLERTLREHPDRVLFGSGAPAVHPNVAVMEVLTLDVPEDAMRRVFERNVARLVPALARDA